MYVIGCAAQAQNGKDTVADRLCEKLNELPDRILWTRASYGDKVKQTYCDAFGVDRAFVEKWKTIEEAPPGFEMPVRKGLQFIGDGFRAIRNTIWIDHVFRDNRPKIISDNRYLNESQRVRDVGGVNILIGRPDKINYDPNLSEAELRPYILYCLNNFDPNQKLVNMRPIEFPLEGDLDKMHLFDFFIRNDGSLEQLYDLIDNQLVSHMDYFFF